MTKRGELCPVIARNPTNPIPRRWEQVTISLVVLLFCVSIFLDSFLAIEPLRTEETVPLDSGWSITLDGEPIAGDVDLPYQIGEPVGGKECLVSTVLPETFPNHNTSLSINTAGSSLEVLVDGKSLYRFDDTGSPWPIPVYGGSATHFIRLEDWTRGKPLVLKMVFSGNSAFSGHIALPVIGTKATEILDQHQEWPSLLFGYSFLLVGVLCLLVSLGFKKDNGKKNIFYFGWIEIALGGWVFTQSCSKLLIIRNPAAPMNLSFAAIFLLPFFLSKFASISYKLDGKERTLCRWTLAFPAAYVLIMSLQLAGIVQYVDLLAASGLALGIFLLWFLAFVAIDFAKGNRNLGSLMAALIVLFVSVLAEELLLVFKVVLPNSMILHLGMSICAIILFWHSTVIIKEGNLTRFREQMLLELAFTDQLTGLKNRSAYETKIRSIMDSKQKNEVIGVLLMDINNLKQINDSKGHQEGDRLLKKFSRTIREMVPSGTETYRIGGDEFVCLIPHTTEEKLASLANDIEQIRFTETSGVAVGHAIYIPKRKEKITNIIFRADTAMYACKNRMKQIG
jgi:diguanylate cyclase (GGDEF)-like protein